MKKDIILMPLGGGQRVGASCYFVKLGEANVILDAGIGKKDDLVFEPDFYQLITTPFLYSTSQLSQIFISHAHIDHIGYLLKLMRSAPNTSVYMTEITAALTKYQLYDSNFICNSRKTEEDIRLATQILLDRIVVVNYMQTIDFGSYKVTFYPAGHIPGAMMMLFEYKGKKLLYTGDYSIEGTLLTGGCYIPQNENIDTVLMCGLHAKHPYYSKKGTTVEREACGIIDTVEREQCPVICHMSQLSKGIEFLKALEMQNVPHIPVYLDDNLAHLARQFEKYSYQLIGRDVHTGGGGSRYQPHIFLTSARKWNEGSRGIHRRVDFTLHEDFGQMKEFIRRINPENIYLVHCGQEASPDDHTIEQEMMRDPECRAQFTFAEEYEIYHL